jgi:hypothetical protein
MLSKHGSVAQQVLSCNRSNPTGRQSKLSAIQFSAGRRGGGSGSSPPPVGPGPQGRIVPAQEDSLLRIGANSRQISDSGPANRWLPDAIGVPGGARRSASPSSDPSGHAFRSRHRNEEPWLYTSSGRRRRPAIQLPTAPAASAGGAGWCPIYPAAPGPARGLSRRYGLPRWRHAIDQSPPRPPRRISHPASHRPRALCTRIRTAITTTPRHSDHTRHGPACRAGYLRDIPRPAGARGPRTIRPIPALDGRIAAHHPHRHHGPQRHRRTTLVVTLRAGRARTVDITAAPLCRVPRQAGLAVIPASPILFRYRVGP